MIVTNKKITQNVSKRYKVQEKNIFFVESKKKIERGHMDYGHIHEKVVRFLFHICSKLGLVV